ncbi:MAG: hypothetical protein PHD03_01095 [Bacilli bacterium]|nr:hypothetical protein [Bacilli bacterium]MDD4406951.1 hypothetical protein [Bacilli bacterium]
MDEIEAFNNIKEESKQYISLISEINDIFSNWGLDLTSLSENIGKDYPVSTKLINLIKTSYEEDGSELELWKLIRKFISLNKLQVKMHFSEYNKNFYQLLYWGDEFLNMNGIDLLYAIYLLLEDQLLNTPENLKGIFDVNRMKILIPEMTATFRNNGDTSIDFSIQNIGNLNILAKRK